MGHQHKITCVRLFGSEKGVITGSADRSLKVWDISRKTYRQTTTLRHSSTSTCVDVASDAVNAVSGHMDGGLRFWDLKSGERTADISGTKNDAGTNGKQLSGSVSARFHSNALRSFSASRNPRRRHYLRSIQSYRQHPSVDKQLRFDAQNRGRSVGDGGTHTSSR